tara:strand:- start:199740 stop:200351 length:612 start_codon:yes stop_codon:yes gene_type:complete
MLKQIFDYSVAICLLIVLSPLMLVLYALIMIFIGKPVIFKQIRPGRNAKPFMLYKFRTMSNVQDESGNLLPDSDRMTKFGNFLRSASLDELPQLFNVLNGDISLVGPRALLPEYLSLYSTKQARRHEVKPGITGWAQVNGRNAISWEDKFKLDVWYVDHQSFSVDIKILCLTFIKVFNREGVSNQEHVTMPKFTGSKLDEKNE